MRVFEMKKMTIFLKETSNIVHSTLSKISVRGVADTVSQQNFSTILWAC